MSDNSSNSAEHPSPPAVFQDLFLATNLPYGVYFAVVAPITVLSNALLLATLYRDPLRCFRTPVTFFVMALASVDLVLGAFVEPGYSVYYFTLHRRKVDKTEAIGKMIRILLWTGNACLNFSFFQILMLTVSQFIAITFPHSYKAIVTTRRVLFSLAASSLYFILFTLLQYTGASREVIFKVDFYLHSTAITSLIAITTALLFWSFRRFNKLSRTVGHSSLNVPEQRGQRTSTHQNPTRPMRNTTRRFTVVTLSLSALLLFTAVPHIVAMYIKQYQYPTTPSAVTTFRIADRICSGLMFVKVALDAFIFAWRLPKYRRALRIVFGLDSGDAGPTNTLDPSPSPSGKVWRKKVTPRKKRQLFRARLSWWTFRKVI